MASFKYVCRAVRHGWEAVNSHTITKDGVLVEVRDEGKVVTGSATWRGVRVRFNPAKVKPDRLVGHVKSIIRKDFFTPDPDTALLHTAILGKDGDTYTACIAKTFQVVDGGVEKTVIYGVDRRRLLINASSPERAKQLLDEGLDEDDFPTIDRFTESTLWGDARDTLVVEQNKEPYTPYVTRDGEGVHV